MAIAHLDRDEWSDSTKAFADVPVTTSSFGAPGSSSAHAMTPAVSFARGPTPGPALAQVLSPSAGHSVLLGSAAAILPAAPGSVPTGLVAAPLDRPLDTTPAPAPQEQRYGDAAPGNSDSAPPWEAALDLTAPPPRLGASRPLGSVQEQPLWDEDPAEGDDDFGDDFEAKVRQAEQRAAAPPPPLPPAYFRSRREAAAVLLRHSHFSSGAKLFGGGAIDVRVSRVFVREATREAASSAGPCAPPLWTSAAASTEASTAARRRRPSYLCATRKTPRCCLRCSHALRSASFGCGPGAPTRNCWGAQDSTWP
jgi:hypothetical protein